MSIFNNRRICRFCRPLFYILADIRDDLIPAQGMPIIFPLDVNRQPPLLPGLIGVVMLHSNSVFWTYPSGRLWISSNKVDSPILQRFQKGITQLADCTFGVYLMYIYFGLAAAHPTSLQQKDHPLA